jgi:hypothetical protein
VEGKVRYENLLNRALRITWRHPWLWLLALLAGESGGGGGVGGGGGSSSGFGQKPGAGGPPPPDLRWLPQWLADRAALLLEIAVAVLLLAILLFLVSCVAEGALIRAVAELDRGERVGLGRAWSEGVSSFWRVLGFRMVQFLLVFVPLVLLVIPPAVGAAAGQKGVLEGLLLDLPLFFAYLFWTMFIGWLSVLAVRACVLDGQGPIACFGAGYRLLVARFPRVALTGVLLAAVGIGVGIVLQLVYGLLSVPFLAGFTDELSRGRWTELARTLVAWFALVLPVSLLLSSAIGAYYSTVWTLAYRRFGVEGEVPEPPPLAA